MHDGGPEVLVTASFGYTICPPHDSAEAALGGRATPWPNRSAEAAISCMFTRAKRLSTARPASADFLPLSANIACSCRSRPRVPRLRAHLLGLDSKAGSLLKCWAFAPLRSGHR